MHSLHVRAEEGNEKRKLMEMRIKLYRIFVCPLPEFTGMPTVGQLAIKWSLLHFEACRKCARTANWTRQSSSTCTGGCFPKESRQLSISTCFEPTTPIIQEASSFRNLFRCRPIRPWISPAVSDVLRIWERGPLQENRIGYITRGHTIF